MIVAHFEKPLRGRPFLWYGIMLRRIHLLKPVEVLELHSKREQWLLRFYLQKGKL